MSLWPLPQQTLSLYIMDDSRTLMAAMASPGEVKCRNE